jgi:FkbM family methyltransferase
MAAAIGRVCRTIFYSAATRILPSRIAAFGGHWWGARILSGVQLAFGGGSVTIAGGAAGRLLLDTDYLLIGHPQGYGLVRGLVEPSVQEAMRRHIAPGATVYDVGGDIGFFSILSARLTGRDGRVESFEPVPASAKAVAANAKLNGFTNVRVHDVAVSDHDGAGTLLIQTDRTWSHLADRGPSLRTRDRVDVALVSLDAQIASGAIPPPDLIKIDVEGSEIAVLQGLTQTLRSRAPTIICELHETNREILELLDQHGYSAENLDGTIPIADAGPVHILARPRTV